MAPIPMGTRNSSNLLEKVKMIGDGLFYNLVIDNLPASSRFAMFQ